MLVDGRLFDKALLAQAGEVAVHLGGALVDFGGRGGKAGRTAQAGQRLEDAEPHFGRLDALPAVGHPGRGRGCGHGVLVENLG
ncbi:hypothetical protein D3C71_1983360 [compost metagenome]